ncbi:hypothetical protein [Bacillus tuaregi]|uniref:hypothetical protein n=1 Tax=Bacillus tuaregi TaxID=1816695 RepID=UPI0008F824C3|nr:hypothetical protein [Bacillus tuaregi]
MEVFIELIYFGQRSEILRKGNFPIEKYNKDLDMAAAEAAIHWIKQIKREHIVSRIIKVTYDKNHDITEIIIAKLEEE